MKLEAFLLLTFADLFISHSVDELKVLPRIRRFYFIVLLLGPVSQKMAVAGVASLSRFLSLTFSYNLKVAPFSQEQKSAQGCDPSDRHFL